MQMHLVVVALALLVGGSSATKAEAGAHAWLRSHGNPNNDQLSELRTENPEAYAIVKALLVKQSMGLLNMKHPSASWSAPPPQDAAPTGAAAYAKFASPGELKPMASQDPYPAASTQMYSEVSNAHVDNWNWSSKHGSDDDDAMVSQVLGAVAELKGKKAVVAQKSQSDDLSPLAQHDADFGVDSSASAAQPAPQPAQPAPEVQAQPAPEAKPAQKNSYLDGLDLNADDSAPAQSVQQQTPAKKVSLAKEDDSVSPLSSFSFGDDDAAPAPQEKPRPVPVQQVQQQQSSLLRGGGGDALSKFLR